MNSRRRLEAGFTLVEALVATTIVVLLTAGVLSALNPARGVFKTQPEVADMQQRLRAGVDALTRDLVSAGAGPYSGAGSGSLSKYFAPIMPFRRGLDSAIDDGVGVFKSDAITIVYVPSTGAQTTVRTDMPTASSQVVIDTGPGCPRDGRTGLVDPLCGFKANVTKAAMFDGTGAFDTLSITSTDEAAQALDFQPQQSALSKAYLGSASSHLSKIVEISSHVYYLNTATHQLMHSDGFSTVTPVLDNVAGLDFEYYGDPSPPIFARPGMDQTVTYGPPPPAAGVTQAPFAPGENCTWQMSGGGQVTRLASLGSPGGGLVKLTASQLTDGPWCPDDVNANRYDADLLRVRKVRVTLRVTSGTDSVPDRSVRFDVSPRNLNFGR
jgi:type II secretory pathway pseudopilin PulG